MLRIRDSKLTNLQITKRESQFLTGVKSKLAQMIE